MSLPEAGVQLVAEGLSQFTTDMGRANAAVADFGQSGGSAGGAFDKGFSEIVIGGLRKIGELGVEALLKAGQAVSQFAGDSVKLAGNFQAGMQNFQAVAGKGVDTKGLEQFRDLFIQLGKELPVSTSDVQNAAIEMIKGGIDPAIVAAGGLRQNIQFAAAAMDGDLVSAAEISSKILGGWADANATAQQKADFLTHSTDLLTKAANASSVDVKGLSQGIFNAQGVAKTAGVSFDDLTTTLAELAPRFASSSEAGNSLKNMIVRLQPTTKPAIEAMQGLGLYTDEAGSAFYDAQGNFVGFQQASQLLQTSLQGLTKEQQAATLQQIFGNDAMSSAAALAELGASGYQNMATALLSANGVAENAALKQQGFNTALENAKGSVEALQITIGSALLPVLGDLLDNYITPAINAITDWTTGILGADDPLLALVQSIDSALPGFSEFVSFIENLSSTLMNGDWAGAFSVIGQGLSDLGETIGPLLIEALSSAVDTAWNWIQEQAPKWIDQLAVWGEAFIDFIKPYIPPMIDALGDLVGDAWDWIKGEAPKWGQQLLTWGQELADWIAPAIPSALAELGKLGSQFLSWIGAQAQPLLTKLGDWASSFTGWIPGATTKFLAEWPKMFDQFLSWIGNQVGPLLKKLGDWAVQFTAWIVPMIPGFVAALGGVALAILAFIGETALTLGKKIVTEWVPALVNWIDKDVIPKLGPALDAMWKNLANLVFDISMKVGQAAADIGKQLTAGIKKGVEDAWGSFTSWLVHMAENVLDEILKAWGIKSPATEWMPLGEFATKGIMQGFADTWPSLMALVGNLGDDMIAKAKSIGESVQGAIADAFGSTASIDRQIADNLDKLGDVLPDYRQYTEGALKAAEQQARAFLDPTEGAQFFKMRSDQILEYADLQKQLADAQDKDDRARIQAKMNLINAAQTAELNGFNANLNAGQSATESLMDAVQKLLLSKVTTKDNKGKEVEVGLPGILDSPTIAAITDWLHQAQNYSPYSSYVNPPASAAQQSMARSSGPVYNGPVGPTLNMPIYTNNTPDALQQSMAIAQAVMP